MKKAIIDIDGVLNSYPQTFIDFCNDTLSKQFTSLAEIKREISYSRYKSLKEIYRSSSYKHNAQISEYAYELFEYLRNSGYLIYIVTARKLFEDNCLENTIAWLKKNNIRYDYMYCSIKKDFTIFEKFNHVDIVIDDNVENVNSIKRINGDNCLYFNVINSENSHNECEGIKVTGLKEVLEILKEKKI